MVRKIPHDTTTQIPGNGGLMPDNEFLAWTEAVPKSFRALAGYRNSTATSPAATAPCACPPPGHRRFLSAPRVTAWRGRLFERDRLKPGAPPTTVLSYAAWQTRFNGADTALARW